MCVAIYVFLKERNKKKKKAKIDDSNSAKQKPREGGYNDCPDNMWTKEIFMKLIFQRSQQEKSRVKMHF
jgi:hypothetical protein